MGELASVQRQPACDGHVDDGLGRCVRCKQFVAGNRFAVVHGAASGAFVASEAEDALHEIDQALTDGPGSEARFRLAREQTAHALARVRRLRRHLERVDAIDRKGRVRPIVGVLDRAETTLARLLAELGMTPLAAGRLGLDLSRVRSITMAERIAAERRNGSQGGP
jgi:hypothetical protein